jgi:hypothetical protein
MIRALLIGILSAGALAACAATPPPVKTAAAHTPVCSRVPQATGSCTSEVSTYSSKQLRQTGETDPAHALRMLDPTVTVIPH